MTPPELPQVFTAAGQLVGTAAVACKNMTALKEVAGRVWVGHSDGTMRVLDYEGAQIASFPAHGSPVMAIAQMGPLVRRRGTVGQRGMAAWELSLPTLFSSSRLMTAAPALDASPGSVAQAVTSAFDGCVAVWPSLLDCTGAAAETDSPPAAVPDMDLLQISDTPRQPATPKVRKIATGPCFS